MWTTIFNDPVTIDTLTFNNGNVGGIIYGIDTLDGWDDLAEPQVVMTSFGYSDGTVDAERFPYKEKYVDISGYVVTGSRLLAQQAKVKLAATFNPNKRLVVTRTGPIPLMISTRVSSRLSFPQVDDHGEAFRWHVQVVAPWPFKLGVNTFTGTAGVFNSGTFYRTYPRTYPITYSISAGASTVGTVTRTNLMLNPGPKTAITGWSSTPGTSGVASISLTTDASSVSGSGKTASTTWTTAQTVANATVMCGQNNNSSTVVAGLAYSGSMYMAPGPSTPGQTWNLAVRWYDVNNALLSTSTLGPDTAITSASWTRLTVSNVVAPANATQATLMAFQKSSSTLLTSGQFISACAAQLEQATAPSAYFDGDKIQNGNLYYSWAGTSGYSFSKESRYDQVVPNVTVSDNVTVVNNGNADAYPIIQILGPLVASSWYAINETTGEQFTLAVDISTGATLVVDTKEKTAYIGSSPVDYWLRGSWPRVSPNGVSNLFHLVTTQANANARMTIITNDTYR